MQDKMQGHTHGMPHDVLVTVDEMRAMLAGPNPPFLLDVRDRDAYLAGHIPGAINIPIDELPGSLDRVPKHRALVTY